MKFAGRIAVFGGRDITEEIYNDTVEIGKQMANENWLVFCGGGEGVMEAIAKGVSMNNGVCIGILKDKDFKSGNEFLSIPISTGLDITRNALISYNCDVGVAISGAYGTLSEIAFTLAQDKPLISYNSWDVANSIPVDSISSLIGEVKNCLNQ
ncbi:MAG: TIGR00725 family protein [Candidatus Marinimicrobia bacterium]|jgi:uncharacterized protein (TIGR00725 family)|nr:TIGR00725 family protein [Gammaproteobacteria bacterium]MBL6911711.1 TIGR00725 family protein [Candidatus Neomarinimicrobiota bacterium]MBT3728130.1 TIGR00725 family protein [Candidatus Neomarinimicrobiota bacterium]MBT3944615.1 TIGR00725 family protein [Candidatus Neomarinimicrobiota bacterium]MBT4112091.1 TIGR00725 family protein [Candidatus Neomarinimicrobiota bacterium]|tara:strand:- start:441 stop:899 length:459 start_codon:yes stop_codon:yes gene_type:complete